MSIEVMKQALEALKGHEYAEICHALRLAIEQAEKQEPVANEMPLHIIRKWPEGFQERLQHVWLDVVSFIPEVKLWDLQRMLAEFGFTMKVYDGAAPPQRQRDHITDGSPCWCNPETNYVDPETGVAVIVHKEPQ